MTFHDDIEQRYQICKEMTAINPEQDRAHWFVAYSILALLRGAALDGALKDRAETPRDPGRPVPPHGSGP